MADQYCRVTVVGERRRVNLAVPARAPITEYALTLAKMCGQDDADAFPAVWSLALAGRAPLPLVTSLDQAGITDGQVLYLRDVAAGEADEPVMFTLEEAVSDAAEGFGRWAWTPRSRAATGVALGMAWLVAALIAAAWGAPSASRLAPGGLGIVAGIASAVCAAVASRRGWPVPGPLRLALAVSVIPEFAVAGASIGGHAAPATAAGGALAGALIAVTAVPDTVTAVLPIFAGIALAVCAPLSATRADQARWAAVLAVLLLLLAGLGPQVTGWLVAYSPFEPRLGAGSRPGGRPAGGVAGQVRRAWLFSAVWNGCLGLAGAADLAWLATAPNWFALALASCAGLALILAARRYQQLTEVVPGFVAGAAGLLAVTLELPARLNLHAWVGPAAATVAGLAILGVGLARSFSTREGKSRPRILLLTLFRALSVALLPGAFGAFRHLLNLGHLLKAGHLP